MRPKFEGKTKEQRLLSAARQVKHDLLMRADVEDDGGKVVNLSAGVWVNLCNTLAEFEMKPNATATHPARPQR